MPAPYDGEELIKALSDMGFHIVRRNGSHAILKYRHPDGEVRTVTIPVDEDIPTGTLRQIADQCGADSFQEWCDWIDDLL
jgi:predicted RNA binding protein YcfA (HicA-like mRNA interferase family)